jgi:hypothetical protein
VSDVVRRLELPGSASGMLGGLPLVAITSLFVLAAVVPYAQLGAP